MTFSKEYLGTQAWHAELAEIFSAPNKLQTLLSFIACLCTRLKIDSAVVLHFRIDEGPSLIYQKINTKAKASTLEEYFNGNYILDPFYIKRMECRDKLILSLREVIEENFSDSEYYRVHYKSAGLIDEICLACDDKQSGFVLLSLSRARGQQAFTLDELSAARAIAPLMLGLLTGNWRDLRNNAEQPTPFVKNSSDFHQHLENARLNFGRSLLTKREFGILQLILVGNSIALIAKKLNISEHTVKVHRKNIYSKLKIKSQSEVFSLFLEAVSSTNSERNSDPLAEYLASA